MRVITKGDVQLHNTLRRIQDFSQHGGGLGIVAGCIVFNDLARLVREPSLRMNLGQIARLRNWADTNLPSSLNRAGYKDYKGMSTGDFYRDCNGVERLFKATDVPQPIIMNSYIYG